MLLQGTVDCIGSLNGGSLDSRRNSQLGRPVERADSVVFRKVSFIDRSGKKGDTGIGTVCIVAAFAPYLIEDVGQGYIG